MSPEETGPAAPQGADPVAPGGVHWLIAPRRLHRAGIVVAALSSLREILVVVVVGIVLRAGSGSSVSLSALLLAVTGAVAAMAIGYLHWWREWYEVDAQALRHRHGIISPDETAIPLPRIQAVDVTQGPLQRLLGVHEVLHEQYFF